MPFTLPVRWSSLQLGGHPATGVWAASSHGPSFGISRHVTAMWILCAVAHPKRWRAQCSHQSLDSSDDASGSSHSLNSSYPRIPKQLGVFWLLVCYLIAEVTWQTQASWPIKPETGFEQNFWMSHLTLALSSSGGATVSRHTAQAFSQHGQSCGNFCWPNLLQGLLLFPRSCPKFPLFLLKDILKICFGYLCPLFSPQRASSFSEKKGKNLVPFSPREYLSKLFIKVQLL